MRNATVTVFGGSGFIGRYTVRRLAASGARVRVAVRKTNTANFLKPMGEVGQISLEAVHLAKTDDLKPFVEGSTHVVNAVGILSEWGNQTFSAVQAQAPGKIARAAAAVGVRHLVHVSAIGADASSQSTYAQTKAAGEAAVREAFPTATILRPSVVFGAEDAFFNRFAGMAQFSPALPLIGGGKTRFQPVYVDDVAAAIVTALNSDEAQGETYELGGPDVYTFKELMQYLLKVIDKKRALISLPFGVANFQARLAELLPNPLLTRDQVTLLKSDNVVNDGAKTFADLGLTATPLEVVVPSYLSRYTREIERQA